MTEKPIAIVTGVGPGTGAAIVKRFSAGGFRIIAMARSAELINHLAQELPDVYAVTCDVSDESQVRTVVADVKRRFGAAEVLIHNAVGGGWGSFREIEPNVESPPEAFQLEPPTGLRAEEVRCATDGDGSGSAPAAAQPATAPPP